MFSDICELNEAIQRQHTKETCWSFSLLSQVWVKTGNPHREIKRRRHADFGHSIFFLFGNTNLFPKWTPAQIMVIKSAVILAVKYHLCPLFSLFCLTRDLTYSLEDVKYTYLTSSHGFPLKPPTRFWKGIR